LAADRYSISDQLLSLLAVPDQFELTVVTRIRPDTNTKLSGLYRSANGYVTQCEAQGFRRITWFPDRPDVMARYSVTLHADKTALPLLLANGNPVAQGDEPGGRHWACWQDPFPKPSYLFALVAAKLEVLRDHFVTASGRTVQLAVYVEPGKLDQCGHAMAALKKSMAWDERRFGLECDLDHYMIVAVGDFNMGAMENKGLNIFNTKYVLARPDVARVLRAAQFPEDAGPMAHPVRPASYVEINNFYTATVYEKGAEVVRMIQTLIGPEAFRRGMDLYFARHDGQAVTCDDFVAAMADAAGADFGQFMRWYDQAGTPRIKASGRYEPDSRRYVLSLAQSCPPSPGQPAKQPYHIPVAVGLVGPDGQDLPLRMAGRPTLGTNGVLSLTADRQEFVFEDVAAAPVPSLLRGFSAPVILEFDYRDEDLAHLLAHDSDPFNRWEAGQRLAARLILAGTEAIAAGREPAWPETYAAAASRVLATADADPAFAAEVLSLPSEATLAEQLAVVDPDALHAARNSLRRFLADRLGTDFLDRYQALAPRGGYRPDTADAGRRSLRNLCLGYLAEADTAEARRRAYGQFEAADNMTDQFAALSVLANGDGPEREQALAAFHDRWQNEALVMDKWLLVQAGSRRRDTLARVRELTQHPAFDIRNPNKVYSLLRGFGANHVRFHAADGEGYRFLAGQIQILDGINPQVAARLARCFDRWKRFDGGRQAHAREALEQLRRHPGLSRDVGEIVARALD